MVFHIKTHSQLVILATKVSEFKATEGSSTLPDLQIINIKTKEL